jgi:hypothetical protein
MMVAEANDRVVPQRELSIVQRDPAIRQIRLGAQAGPLRVAHLPVNE